MEIVVRLLKELNFTISSCESITGGLFSKQITDISNSSQVFKGAIVSYTNDIKINLVKIKADIFKKFGAISSECALAMAQNVREIFKTDVAISFTGNAGSIGSESKPIGLIYIAVVFKEYFFVEKFVFHGIKKEIRSEAVNVA